MPSTSAAQHRWIGAMHSHPDEAKKAGLSPSKVQEWLHADRGSPWKRDDGGQIPNYTGGITDPAPTAQNQSPLAQGMMQKYSSMPTEQLTELAARLGGSQQGQMINQLLMRRRMMPAQDPEPQAPQQTSQPVKKGGKIKRDSGGVMSASEGSPWWTRREAAGADSGFLHGSTPGRADAIKTQALPGSYIIPADVVSGLGEGNSLAGAKAIQAAIDTGPWGTPLPRPRGRSTIPHPPPLPTEHSSGGEVPIFDAKQRSKGGANTGNTPVDLSDGEFVVSPKDCERFGNGDRSAGHRWWDDWVLRKRKDHINKLKKLPPPVKP